MVVQVTMNKGLPTSLAARLRQFREAQGLSLDELASKADLSKTYLWELEKDVASAKKPSADVLLRIAAALSVTIADLLDLPTVSAPEGTVEIPASLQEFRDRMKKLGAPLTNEDVRDLAMMKFRGGQPQTVDEWHQVYLAFSSSPRRRTP
jgi:transcriptional regulator with XRE-family HTH domain